MNDLKSGEVIQLTDQLQATLRQVKPRAQFIIELKRKLIREAYLEQHMMGNWKQMLIWVAVGAGSLIYMGTIFFVSAKSMWWILSAIGAVLGWRKSQEQPKQIAKTK